MHQGAIISPVSVKAVLADANFKLPVNLKCRIRVNLAIA